MTVETLAPDRVLGGRYRLRQELARGGMAAVWEAEDRVLARRVAIKVLHPHLAGDVGFRTRFRREAVAAAKLAHPHIVTTYDTGRDADVAYIVMELVDGVTLARLLKTQRALPLDQAVDIAAQVADALACAHAHGIIHRDVKPANILLRPDGHVKVADFGIAKAGAGNDLTRTGVVMGTAKYLSPEQVSGNPADAVSDVYALGIVLYEMLCGTAPFIGDSDLSTAVARLTVAPEGLRDRRPEIPRNLEAVVLRSLARDPETRFRSAAEMRASLLAVDLNGSAEADTPPAGVVLPAGADRHFPARTVTAVAVILILLLAAVLVTGDHGQRPSTPPPAGEGPLAAAAVPAVPTTFDPEGDREENQRNARHLLDGDPETFWRTERYNENFPRLKSGVGVYFDLGTSGPVTSLEVSSPQPGWRAEVYVADRPESTLAGWGEPVAAGHDRFDLGRAKGRYVLLWITSLPPVENGYRLDVSQVKISR